jgi:hypothetical protein
LNADITSRRLERARQCVAAYRDAKHAMWDDVTTIDGVPGTFIDQTVVSMRFIRRPDFEALQEATPIGRMLRAEGGTPHRVYIADRPDGMIRVMTSRVPPQWGHTWRMSISHSGADGHSFRLPSWCELKRARYELLRDVANMALVLPTSADRYVDVMPYCLLLMEIPAGVIDEA